MVYDKLKNLHKLENIGHSDLILCVYLDLVHVQICIIYGGSMAKHLDMKGENRKMTAILKNSSFYCLGLVQMHTCIKYEGCMIKYNGCHFTNIH